MVLRITVLPLVVNSWQVRPIQLANLRLLNSCNSGLLQLLSYHAPVPTYSAE